MTSRGFARPHAALSGQVSVPGSKSVSNRAIVCAALALGESSLRGVAGGDDTERLLDAVQLLGAEVARRDDTIVLRGPIDTSSTTELVLDAGLAGTTSRFLTAVAVLRSGRTTVTGEPGLLARPMGELHRLVRELGADVHGELEGYLPVTIEGLGVSPSSGRSNLTRTLTARGDVSSQFISAIMMIAPMIGGVNIRLEGDVVSSDYLRMTARVMESFGVRVRFKNEIIEVPAANYRPMEFVVDADWSSASYAFAAVAIVGGSVRVPHLRAETTQPESQFLSVLESLGCTVRNLGDDKGVQVSRGPSQTLTGVDVDMSTMSDLVPTLAVIAACASTETIIRGVGFIRSKESDRLGDLAAELKKCGIETVVMSDGIRIRPMPLRPAVLLPHHDHRLAMSLSLLGLREDGIKVEDAHVVSKSWPDFWESMSTGLQLSIVG